MKYKARLAAKNDNVSHESPLKEFAILISGVVFLLALITYLLGFAINFAVGYLSYEDEAKLFDKIPFDFAQIIAAEKQPEPDQKLQALVDKLRRCSVLPVSIKAYQLDQPEANAVALPGGKMLVFAGLFDDIQSENGLAFVLAHELGHFINRDHLKGLGRGMVLAVISSLITGPSSGLSRLLTSGMSFDTARFSQQRESMADITALEILNCHYGHVGGATEFFETLQAEQLPDSAFSHYFSSHPQIEQRIASIRAWQEAAQISSEQTIVW